MGIATLFPCPFPPPPSLLLLFPLEDDRAPHLFPSPCQESTQKPTCVSPPSIDPGIRHRSPPAVERSEAAYRLHCAAEDPRPKSVVLMDHAIIKGSSIILYYTRVNVMVKFILLCLEWERFGYWSGSVALLVFGRKGLSEARQKPIGGFQVAHNLGKTLQAFRPTIRELQFLCHRKCRGMIPRAPLSVRSDLMKLELFYMLMKKGKQLLIHVTEEQLTTSAATSKIEAVAPKEQPRESTSETLAETTLGKTSPNQVV
ncbi:hypothetical protein C4D60_Mb04t11780 [Musa balbisiana]|uniref:Uncharacterized protein n=1 Tax=Musa balbisiana TaxID=52838 RepID=A0A4S8KBD9_MUSBA|nr:hypothetical protein C4D60_Mb04t11780 [Musa balbisiana]